MNAVTLIASIVAGRVVIAGSLPPAGRDLDLIVQPEEAEAIAAGLEAAGYEGRGRTWARFHDCTADVVEVAPVDAWRLTESQARAMFDEAEPLEPTGRVCRPSPRHAVMILARRLVRAGEGLHERHRHRIAAELERDAGAFAGAAEIAEEWGGRRALEALERAYAQADAPGAASRRRAMFEEFRRSRPAAAAWIAAWRAVLPRPRRGALLSVWAADRDATGAEHLAAALDRLGYGAVMRPGAASPLRDLLAGRTVVREAGSAELPKAAARLRRLMVAPASRIRVTYVVDGSAVRSDGEVRLIESGNSAAETCAALARAAWADLA